MWLFDGGGFGEVVNNLKPQNGKTPWIGVTAASLTTHRKAAPSFSVGSKREKTVGAHIACSQVCQYDQCTIVRNCKQHIMIVVNLFI